MTTRRFFLQALFGGAAIAATSVRAEATVNLFDFPEEKKPQSGLVKKNAQRRSSVAYSGATIVDFPSVEKPGTIIIKTQERALYQILDKGKAKRFLVAVGKEGFAWSGVAKVGMKRENPMWTPPPEMIDRKPEYAKWADGMPGGLPINPLGPRAMYLFAKGGDTGFRIHGTIHPESIGTAASSGCIRMLNREVIDLYAATKVGTKVIVI